MLMRMQATRQNDRDPLGMARVLRVIHGSLRRRQPLKLSFACVGGRTSLYLQAEPTVGERLAKQLYGEYPDVELVRVAASELALPSGHQCTARQLSLSPDLFPLPNFLQQANSDRKFSDPLPGILEALGDEDATLWSHVELTLVPARRRSISWRRWSLLTLSCPTYRSQPQRARRFAVAIVGPWWARTWALVTGLAVRLREQGIAERELVTSARRDGEGEDDLTIATEKLGSFLFSATLRVAVAAPVGKESLATAKLDELTAAVKAAAQPRLTQFHIGRRQFLLGEGELASLFHPPLESMAAAKLVISESRQPEPSDDMPHAGDNAVPLGHVLYRGRRQLAGLHNVDARRHQYVIGRTGVGKSVFLQNQLRSRIHAGDGVMLLEPHGDLYESTLRSCPRRRWHDVVAFDPTAANPISYNPLDCPDPAQRERLAAGLMAAFESLFALDHGGTPRLLHILRFAVLTAMEVSGATLLTIVDLLRDDVLRRDLVAQVGDPFVRAFWELEYDAWTDRYRQEATPAILNKLGSLLTYQRLRNVLCQPKTSLDFRQIADEGQILLCNLSVGHLGGDVSRLLGKFLLSSLHAAIMTRAELPEPQRRDFYLTVDEVAEFDCPALAEQLEQVRKYRLNLTLAHQHLNQLSERTRQSILANAGTFTTFSLGYDDAEIMAQQLGNITAADIVGLRKYHAYLALMIDGKTSSPMLMKTFAPTDSLLSDDNRNALLQQPTRTVPQLMAV